METKPKSKRATTGKRDSSTPIGTEIQSKIGAQLRAMYDDVVSEGVPDRFAELVRQIEASPPKESE